MDWRKKFQILSNKVKCACSSINLQTNFFHRHAKGSDNFWLATRINFFTKPIRTGRILWLIKLNFEAWINDSRLDWQKNSKIKRLKNQTYKEGVKDGVKDVGEGGEYNIVHWLHGSLILS